MTTRREALKTMTGVALVPMLGGAAAAALVAPETDDMETRAARWVTEEIGRRVWNGGWPTESYWTDRKEWSVQRLAETIRGLKDEPHQIPLVSRDGQSCALLTIRRMAVPNAEHVAVTVPQGNGIECVSFFWRDNEAAARKYCGGFTPIRWVAETE